MNKKIFKIALGIEYNGSRYHGWQYQKSASSIQEKLEYALSYVANHSIRVQCAGRTDSGVHSTGQVIHFCTCSIRKNHSWILGVNRYLPKDISVIWIKKVPLNFHARYSALSRRYRYVFYNDCYRSSIFHNGLNFFHKPLNVNRMNKASECLVGEHDFSSFQANNCQSKTSIRKIFYLNVFKIGKLVVVDIIANAFLYHMVRNIVGCLIEVGTSKKHITWIEDILNIKNNNFVSKTVNPNGLYLVQIKYSNIFNLPKYPIGPFFINKNNNY